MTTRGGMSDITEGSGQMVNEIGAGGGRRESITATQQGEQRQRLGISTWA